MTPAEALANAGRLKQLCQSVLDVMAAVEQLGSIEQTAQETQGRLDRLRAEESAFRARAVEAEQQVHAAKEHAKTALAQAQRQARDIVEHAHAQAEGVRAEAEQHVREAQQRRQDAAQAEAASQQQLRRVQAEVAAQEQQLAQLRATIQGILKAGA